MSTSLILLMELTTSLTLKSENGKFQKAREQVMEVPVGVCTSPLDEFLINKVLKLLGNQSFHLTSLVLTRLGMERVRERERGTGAGIGLFPSKLFKSSESHPNMVAANAINSITIT